jgi:TRAP-type C4-dicarboxylate transport system permease small subunit
MNEVSSGKTARGWGRVFETVENIFSFYLNGLIIGFVMFFISTEIICRYFFNFSFLGVMDIVELTMLVIAFASLSGVQRYERHIKVDLVERRLQGKWGGFVLKLFNRLLTLVVSIVLFYISIMALIEAYQDNILTWMIYLPKWPTVAFVPVGWLLLCIRVCIQIRQGLVSERPGQVS